MGRDLSTATFCTSAEPFTLDTNILVYSVDRTAGARHELAKQIMQRAMQGSCYLTLQAISEFYAAATRRGMMPRADAAQVAQAMISLFPTIPATVSAVRVALQTAALGRASYWDSLLVATAADAGCTVILTEDLADGALLLGVQIVNPFAGGTLSKAAQRLLSPA